jgi:hypothetical protein
VETIKALPEPRVPVRYEHLGEARTLTEWAEVTGISKTTLHYRLVTCRMLVADALSLGRMAPRGVDPRRKPAAEEVADRDAEAGNAGAADCETGVKVSV